MAQKDIVIAVRSVLDTELTEESLDEQSVLIDKFSEKLGETLKKFKELPFADGEKEVLDEVENNWRPLYDLGRKVIELTRKKTPESLAERNILAHKKLDELRKKLRDPVEALRAVQSRESDKWEKLAQSIGLSAKYTILFSGIIGLIFGFVLAIYFTNYLVQLLGGISGSLSVGADEVATASRTISASSDELSSNVAEQAAALQETSAAIEEIRAMVAKTANNATVSADLSEGNQKVVHNGQELVQNMIDAIQEINDNNVRISERIEESNREIQEIVGVITEIGSKTQVINDIVFQTKLLSFNASVEAARAGEHGKGFAVVAEEVGNLAQMSGTSATEISGLIQGSLGKVENIVNNTKARVEDLVKTSREKVDRGTSIARECDQAFQEIVSKSTEMSALVREIATASHEQALGIGEVSRAISQLEQVTQKNSANSVASAQESTKLEDQASSLNAVVAQLSDVIDGFSESSH
ncbi:unnamed protein product [Sphagnum tenellum]